MVRQPRRMPCATCRSGCGPAATLPRMSLLTPALAVLVAYLIGSLSFAVIVSRGMGLQDPRHYGSGNPGATNVLRSGNRAAALLTLAFDALKGYVPVLLVRRASSGWRRLPATCGRCSSASRAARAWPPPRACCWR